MELKHTHVQQQLVDVTKRNSSTGCRAHDDVTSTVIIGNTHGDEKDSILYIYIYMVTALCVAGICS